MIIKDSEHICKYYSFVVDTGVDKYFYTRISVPRYEDEKFVYAYFSVNGFCVKSGCVFVSDDEEFVDKFDIEYQIYTADNYILAVVDTDTGKHIYY